MNILIVEDYQKINNLLATFVQKEGHRAIQVYDAETAIETCQKTQCDVILLDLMLPDMQGETLIKHIREVSDVYIIVISAKIDLKDRIDVITIGADDYMTKPFSIQEVMAKLRNVEKRLVISRPTIYTYNQSHLKVSPLKREVFVSGQLVTLTKHEYDVLWYLMKHTDIVCTRDMIMMQCFDESEAYDRVIDTFIKNIRKKIDNPSANQSYIKTHYGLGYQFAGVLDA